MTLVDDVLTLAVGCVGLGEEPPFSNAGPFVELCQRVCHGKKGDPWCAAFVATVGVSVVKAAWPLPRTESCQALADFAAKHGVLLDTGRRGDILLVWHPELKRFAHALLVNADPVRDIVDTVSGNTTKPGQKGDSREGWVVARKPWRVKPED